jgi:hypothetical protein
LADCKFEPDADLNQNYAVSSNIQNSRVHERLTNCMKNEVHVKKWAAIIKTNLFAIWYERKKYGVNS